MKTVKIIRLQFAPEVFQVQDIPRLRAFLARQFPEYSEIHNHAENGKFRYSYPEIQFKFLNAAPAIVGYGSGFTILAQVFNKVGFFEINHRRIMINEKSLQVSEEKIGLSSRFLSYRFATPWMALNQKNYHEFISLNPYRREMKLNCILWGNFKTVAHAFEYWIPDPEQVKVNGHFKMREGQFKGNTMLTFSGEFISNFHIPEFLGLGKQVARGYGTVEKKDEK